MMKFQTPREPIKEGSAVIRFRFFFSPRGTEDCGDPQYVSRFGFSWWFWIPRIHTQKPDIWNPRVLRVIWLCVAFNVDIWGSESKKHWPIDEAKSKETHP